METLLISSAVPFQCGLRNIAHIAAVGPSTALLGLADGRVFYCCVSSDDMTILHDFDASPESTGLPLLALRYVAHTELDFALTQSQNGVMWMHLRDAKTDLFFPGAPIADGVDIFDVIVVGHEALVCTLNRPSKLIQVIRTNRSRFDVVSEFDLPREVAGNVSNVTWACSSILAVTAGTHVVFLALDGSIVPPILDEARSEEILMTPLGHSFAWNDRTGNATYTEQFCVIWATTAEYFRFKGHIMMVTGGEVRLLKTFSLLSNHTPRFASWRGPWIVVGGPHGLDFYDAATGGFAQSTLEDAEITVCDVQSQVMMCDKPAREWFTKRRTSLCVDASGQLIIATFLSVAEIIGCLLRNAAFQMDAIESLMQFGHSVGANLLMPPGAAANVSAKSHVFTPYGGLISRFAFSQGSDEGDSSNGSDSGSPRRASSSNNPSCPVCHKQISIIGSQRCVVCKQKVCSSCCRKVLLAPLGLTAAKGPTTSSTAGPLCRHCDGGADQNLYRLFLARRYHHIIRYVSMYSDRCTRFPVDEVIQCCIEQCFNEQKYRWCAKLVCQYVRAVETWHTWIMNFALQGRLGILVDILPDSAGEIAGSSILLQLIRHDATRLHRVVRRWKPHSYDWQVVCNGIETRLKQLQRDAEACRDGCIVGCGPTIQEGRSFLSGHASDAVGHGGRGVAYAWYFTKDAEHLLQSLLRIIELCEESTHVPLRQCTLYVEHWLDWAPGGEYFSATRRRSESVFADCPREAPATRRFVDVFDFWETFSSQQLIEPFLKLKPKSSTSNEPLLLALLRHHCVDLCRHLFSFESSVCSEMVDEVILQLQSHKHALLRFLHELTLFSPQSTANHHQFIADLYLELDPSSLLAFVRNKKVESLDWLKLAAQVEQRRMFPELVYIIGRTGNDVEAVRVALRCLGDVSLAIEYVIDSEDETLWDVAIGHVLQSQELIGRFLDVVGDRYDPAAFLRRIPIENRLRIDNICPRLGRLCVDRMSTVNIGEAQVHVVQDESFIRLKELRKQSTRAVRFNPVYGQCLLCKQPTFVGDVMVVGLRGCLHTKCFEETFQKSVAKHEHMTKALLWDLVRYRSKRGQSVRDLVELVPANVVGLVAAFLEPYGRLCCEAVSTRWRRTFLSFRKCVFTTGGNLFAVYRQKVHARSAPSMSNTAHTTTLSRSGVYYLADVCDVESDV